MTKIAFTWDAPDESLLEDRRGDLPEFPADVFPPRLSGWLDRASRGAGTLVDHIAVPMLGVTSSLIGKARRIRASSSWIEPATLWASIIGESGSRKTPGSRAITRTLDQIEADNQPQHREAHAAHEARIEKAKAERNHWRKQCEEALNKTPPQEPPPMPIEAVDPGDFIWPSIYVSDSTIQRLARLCIIRPRGMLQVRDELAGLMASIKQQTGGRAFYLEAWDGGKFVVERVDDKRTLVVPNLLVGVVGGFQPDKLSSAFRGDQDGLYARFLYGWPGTPKYASLTDIIQEVDPEFQNLVTKLIRLPAEDSAGEFRPRIVSLSVEARAKFEEYRQFVDRTKRGIEGRESEWLSKSETHTLRLAGTLEYLSWASVISAGGLESISASLEPNEISWRSMADAVLLMREYFWLHARAALRLIGQTDRHAHARKALRWIRAHELSEVSVKDIRRDCLQGAIDAEQTRALLDRLVAAGWLQLKKEKKTGGRPLERWQANPLLAGSAGTATSPLSAVFCSSCKVEIEEEGAK
jgi:hypothetical protein